MALVRRYRQAMAAAMEAAGHPAIPPGAAWLLLAIDRRPGTVSELAGRLGVTKQALSRMADRLAGRGYCERTRGATDQREVVLAASAAGAAAAVVLRETIAAVEADVLAPASARDRDDFLRILAVLTPGALS